MALPSSRLVFFLSLLYNCRIISISQELHLYLEVLIYHDKMIDYEIRTLLHQRNFDKRKSHYLLLYPLKIHEVISAWTLHMPSESRCMPSWKRPSTAT